jgi:hypothetical protein
LKIITCRKQRMSWTRRESWRLIDIRNNGENR